MADDPVKPTVADPNAPLPSGASAPAASAEAKGPGTIPVLDALFGVASDKPLAQVIAIPPAEDTYGLGKTVDVQDAMPIIAKMIAEEKREFKPNARVYPRRLLRQQHIVAFMLCNPFATTAEICNFFQISPSTFYNISKSDTFKSLVNAHKVSLDAGIGGDLRDQMRETLQAAVGVVQAGLVTKQDPDFALQVADKMANRLGMGVKHVSNPTQVNVNVVTPEMIAAARSARILPNAR